MKQVERLICPLCGSKIEYGVEETILHTRVVKSNDGRLNKTVRKRRVLNGDDREYLFCTNSKGVECDWVATSEETKDKSLFQKLNSEETTSFYNGIKKI